MEEGRDLLAEIATAEYDAADKPFDFVESDVETALICEGNEAVREKIMRALENMGYHTTKVTTALEALKAMRFHLFDIVVINERFDGAEPDKNDVLLYLEGLAMATRRRIFVALLTERYRTMDNMAAFHRSVNAVVNLKNIDDVEKILRAAIAENQAFYRVMRETLKTLGRL